MEILIVSKTQMAKGICVGGLIVQNKANVRLLNPGNLNQPLGTDFEIGEIWDCRFIKRDPLKAPHYEDRILLSKQYLRDIPSVAQFIRSKSLIDWKGSPEECFDGLITFDEQGKGFLSEDDELPDMSVGFLEIDKPLYSVIDTRGKVRYNYTGDSRYSLPYVGLEPAIEKINAKTICRVSLTRLFNGKYWLQLSGWY